MLKLLWIVLAFVNDVQGCAEDQGLSSIPLSYFQARQLERDQISDQIKALHEKQQALRAENETISQLLSRQQDQTLNAEMLMSSLLRDANLKTIEHYNLECDQLLAQKRKIEKWIEEFEAISQAPEKKIEDWFEGESLIGDLFMAWLISGVLFFKGV